MENLADSESPFIQNPAGSFPRFLVSSSIVKYDVARNERATTPRRIDPFVTPLLFILPHVESDNKGDLDSFLYPLSQSKQ